MTDSSIVTTNLRIPTSDWQQVRVMAAEMGISVNEYVKRALQAFTAQTQFGYVMPEKNRAAMLRDLPRLAKKAKKDPVQFEANDDDKIIYGLD